MLSELVSVAHQYHLSYSGDFDHDLLPPSLLPRLTATIIVDFDHDLLPPALLPDVPANVIWR